MEIPVGYRFAPSDDELVSFYLKNKAIGQPLPWNTIIERDIYGDKSPWGVFNSDDPWVESVPGESKKMSLYVFTTLKFLGKKTAQKQIARTAGCGFWHGVTGLQDIVDNVTGHVIGKKETFSYVSRDESLKGVKGYWYMHEYALTGSSLCVLCKITRDDSKLLKVQIKKGTTHVSNQEGGNYVSNTSTKPQVFTDGFEKTLMEEEADSDFARKLEAYMMNEDDQEYQGGTNKQTIQDLDFDNATRMTRCEATTIHVFNQEGGEQINNKAVPRDDYVANTNAQTLHESHTTVPSPDQLFPNEDLFDGCSEEFNMMLMEDMMDFPDFEELWMSDNDQYYQGGLNQPLWNDLDHEHTAKRM